MITALLDHIITFTNASDIDEYIEEYRSRGFIVSEATHRYKPGLRNRLITLDYEYVEIAGVQSFALTYHGGTDGMTRQVLVAPNTIYALEGLTLVCATPEQNATRWRDVLAPKATIYQNVEGCTFALGAHTLHWMTAEQCRSV